MPEELVICTNRAALYVTEKITVFSRDDTHYHFISVSTLLLLYHFFTKPLIWSFPLLAFV